MTTWWGLWRTRRRLARHDPAIERRYVIAFVIGVVAGIKLSILGAWFGWWWLS